MSSAPSMNENLKFVLEIVKGPHEGLRFESSKTAITIGRDAENDVVLNDDPRVSRQHVEIKQSLGEFYVVNMSQKNFVLVDGQAIESQKLQAKSVIQVGESEIRFSVPGSTALLEPLGPVTGAPAKLSSVPAAPRAALPSAPASPVMAPNMTPTMPNPLPPRPPPGAGPSSGVGSGAQTGARRPPPPPLPLDLSKLKVYFFVGLALLIGGSFLLNQKPAGKAKDRAFRTSEELDLARQESENAIQAFQDRKDKMSQEIYKKAYENFVRGARDYQHGQFVRAREAFQVVLNLDPDNELAKRYWNLSKIKFDETVKAHMLQGRRYLERQNFRMCRASFQTVMTMLGNDQTNPEYNEAKLLHRQCSVALEGRF